MKTSYLVVGLIILAAIIAVVFVLSQPRGTSSPGSLVNGNTAGGAANTFAGIWQGLGIAGTAAVGAADS